MSLQLNLLPFKINSNFSQEVIQADQCDAYEKIKALNKMQVDDGFNTFMSRDNSYKGAHYGKTTKTSYGEPLMWVISKDLKTVGLTGTAGAYVAAMDDRDRVALYWH